jgi:glycosyltransferase involved in cell wall biosynthesis
MKIIRFSTFLDFGGLETRLANVSHWKDENEWVFMCLDREGEAAEKIKENGKRVLNLKTQPSIYSFKTFKRVYKALKKEKPDVLHTSGAEANFHGIIAGKLAGVPQIISEEIGIPSHSRLARILFSLIYKEPKYILGNSNLVLEAVHMLNSVPNSKLRRIDNPLIFKELTEIKTRPHPEFIISMVSRLETVKNIEGAIRVLGKLIKNYSYVRLIIAGTGSGESSLKELVKKLNLEETVTFLGKISDPYSVYQNSNLYLLNSFTEGFSNSLLEAMYSKTPVLSTAVGSAPEIIKEGENGFLVEPNKEEILFDKLSMILKLDSEKLAEIGRNGHDIVVSKYSLENHIEKLMEVYEY